MSLRSRLALLFALGTAFVISAAAVAFALQLRVSLDASLDPGLRAQVSAVADELGPGGGFRGSGFTSLDGIVQVATVDGRVLQASPAAGTRLLLTPQQRRQAVHGQVSFTATVGGDRSRVLATSVDIGSGVRRLVVVSAGTDVSDAAIENVRTALEWGGIPAVVLAGGAAWLLAGAALRPVERMRREAAAIGERDVGRRLQVPATRDEVAALGATLNGLLSRLEQALSRERGFVADAGHELRTPLAVLRAELELAARPGRDRQALVDAVVRAGQETDRLIRLAEDLLLLARLDDARPVLRREHVRLAELLGAAARGAQLRSAAEGVSIAVSAPETTDVVVDADRFRQAIDNLLDNAVRYSPPNGRVDVVAEERGDGGVEVRVQDEGQGFPEDFLPHAFERFQRAEAARSRDTGGTGLGLSIVRAILVAHGGSVMATNRATGGAVVALRLPPPTMPEPSDVAHERRLKAVTSAGNLAGEG